MNVLKILSDSAIKFRKEIKKDFSELNFHQNFLTLEKLFEAISKQDFSAVYNLLSIPVMLGLVNQQKYDDFGNSIFHVTVKTGSVEMFDYLLTFSELQNLFILTITQGIRHYTLLPLIKIQNL